MICYAFRKQKERERKGVKARKKKKEKRIKESKVFYLKQGSYYELYF